MVVEGVERVAARHRADCAMAVAHQMEIKARHTNVADHQVSVVLLGGIRKVGTV